MPATVAPMAHLSPEDLGRALATAPDPELARVARSPGGGAAGACLGVAIGPAALDGIAVIGLGKLGGGELNYASDVDVVFVQADGGGSGRDDGAARACGAPAVP